MKEIINACGGSRGADRSIEEIEVNSLQEYIQKNIRRIIRMRNLNILKMEMSSLPCREQILLTGMFLQKYKELLLLKSTQIDSGVVQFNKACPYN